ncbi:TetR/AcrR family transcriptional regulator [Nonomuraea dietziae]|uniref:TetR/AcrR family transcriptional regulator n=1 Tax=Nonomuraea dietziae TaxID=65515 RepID=UPI0033DC3610
MTATQPRGLRRRAALLAAAVDLLTEGGFAAVTHRAVAQRAQLPLAATTYYFTSRDHLLAEAFACLVDSELAATRAWVADHGLEQIIDEVADADRGRQLALWELYVHAGRDPALQQLARRWTDGCVAIVADALGLPAHDPTARLIYTTVTAQWLEHVVEQRPVADARALLALALRAVPSRPDTQGTPSASGD